MSAALDQIEYVSIEQVIPLRRAWAFPSKNTFDIAPIRTLVRKYLYESKVSVDPFARNNRWATYTNDLNANTAAEYHLDALEFLLKMKSDGVSADLVLFDPPYSPTQIKECYEGIGLDRSYRAGEQFWSKEKYAIDDLVRPGGVVMSFGWNSIGMDAHGEYQKEFILLCCHGSGHNDTIVTVERKSESQQDVLQFA